MTVSNKKLNVNKLASFGFSSVAEGYIYEQEMADGQLLFKAFVSKDGTLNIKLYDVFDGEEYVLHLVESAEGSFVGQVRNEYQTILNRILNSCFDDYIFKTIQANDVLNHIKKTYGIKPEFPWNDENSIVRRRDNSKWFAAFLMVSANKLGLDSDEILEVVNLKMKPQDVESLVDGKKYFPAYHMNKKHWVTIPFGGYLSTKEIIQRIDDSYKLTK